MTERDHDDEQPQPDGGFKMKQIEDDVEGHRFHGTLTEDQPKAEGNFKIKNTGDDTSVGPEEAARHF